MENRTYRMYGLVPYNISPIQQGIQFGHGVVEYGLTYGDMKEYQIWANRDKTFIILNGGTTNSRRFDGKFVGSLNQHASILPEMGIKTARFYEPDLGDELTAVVFLVDDRAFDFEKWPPYSGKFYVDGTPEETDFWNWKMQFDEDEKIADRIVWMRSWLRNFKLA